MPSEAGRRLTLLHKQAQQALGTQAAADLLAVWPLLDPDDLDGTFEQWLTAAVPIVRRHHVRSASLAAAYLNAYRTAETGQPGPLAPAEDEPDEAITTSLLVTGPVAVKSAMTRGEALERAMEVSAVASAAAGARHALAGGRNTIRRSIEGDPDAIGYHRVASGSSCNYCRARTDAVFDSAVVFPAHDGCGCTAEPVYR